MFQSYLLADRAPDWGITPTKLQWDQPYMETTLSLKTLKLLTIDLY